LRDDDIFSSKDGLIDSTIIVDYCYFVINVLVQHMNIPNGS